MNTSYLWKTSFTLLLYVLYTKYIYSYYIWLLVWYIFYSFHIFGTIIPFDFHSFHRGRYTTNQTWFTWRVHRRHQRVTAGGVFLSKMAMKSRMFTSPIYRWSIYCNGDVQNMLNFAVTADKFWKFDSKYSTNSIFLPILQRNSLIQCLYINNKENFRHWLQILVDCAPQIIAGLGEVHGKDGRR